MNLFGEHDPKGGDGYIPGAWDQVREAAMDGSITDEAYEVLHRAIQHLREEGYEDPGPTEFVQPEIVVPEVPS